MYDTEKIKEAHDLKEHILKTHGPGIRTTNDEYLICCPFHQEKTPSFRISSKRYHCFGCGERGDIFTWYERVLKMPFRESAARLGNGEFVQDVASYKQKATKRTSEVDCEARLERIESNKRYYDSLIRYTPSTYKNIGTGTKYDDKKARIIIPFFDESGKNIFSFSGRTVEANALPKYLHARSDEGWQNSRYLWGRYLWQSKQGELNSDVLYITEGFWDTCAIVNGGNTALACMGTNLSSEQCNLIAYYIERYCIRRVAIAFDGDNAGYKGAFKAAMQLQKSGIAANIVLMPRGYEPDKIDTRHLPLYLLTDFVRVSPRLFLGPKMLNENVDTTELQKVFDKCVQANIDDGYAHLNVLAFAFEASEVEQDRANLRSIIDHINLQAGQVNVPYFPGPLVIKQLFDAWKAICREVRRYGQ